MSTRVNVNATHATTGATCNLLRLRHSIDGSVTARSEYTRQLTHALHDYLTTGTVRFKPYDTGSCVPPVFYRLKNTVGTVNLPVPRQPNYSLF
jgi:hypothetical protein